MLEKQAHIDELVERNKQLQGQLLSLKCELQKTSHDRDRVATSLKSAIEYLE